MTNPKKKLQSILERTVDGKRVFGASFAMKRGDFTWAGAAGNLSVKSPYFIASATKLFTIAAILQLRATGALDITDLIAEYLDINTLAGLHFYRGKDYTQALTVSHLLAHTSGIPDYFQRKDVKGTSLVAALMSGNDQAWTPEEAIARSKLISPLFAPGAKGKAHYSDTNYQLLGKIIERITGQTFADYCYDQIIVPYTTNARH